MTDDIIFTPLQFRHLRMKNRVIRSSLSGRFDNFDGSGTETRIAWELKFARGGVGAIISANAPVHTRGLIIPNYARIDHDNQIPFWRELVRRVQAYDCKYIIQLVHSGRQQDIAGLQYDTALSSTNKPDPLHGYECTQMTIPQIREVVEAFRQAAGRARLAGADGIEIHASNGYLITQFLSSGINERDDQYGGSLENRARLLIEIVRAVRAEVGRDYHVQVKLSTTEYNNALFPWLKKGNSLAESIEICRWLEQEGVDALHVSTGSTFPHPRNPAGEFPLQEVVENYDSIISNGRHALRNYLVFRTWPLGKLFKLWWERAHGPVIEGINLPDSRAIKRAIAIPVMVTGGFQTASVIRRVLEERACDAVTIARPLMANPNMLELFRQGHDRPPQPCSYCNKCIGNFVELPLGCYDERRFSSREEMIRQVLSIYDAPSFFDGRPADLPAAEQTQAIGT